MFTHLRFPSSSSSFDLNLTLFDIELAVSIYYLPQNASGPIFKEWQQAKPRKLGCLAGIMQIAYYNISNCQVIELNFYIERAENRNQLS